MDVVRPVVFVVGLFIVVATASSVFMTLVMPRASSSRILWTVGHTLAAGARLGRRLLSSYESQDRLMAAVGPGALVVLFVTWLGLLVVGFGFMAYWVSGTSFASAMAVGGSSVFTLGIATSSHADALEFVAAGMGLLVVALEIAYLPTLYSSFSDRETEVTLLATRAGQPPWGPEVLNRHYRFGIMAELPDLYRRWERWAAEVSESHTNYPALMWFRSPVGTRSWLLSLASMLDAASLQMSACPTDYPFQARTFLRMGIECVRSLATAMRVEFNPDPLPTDPIRLTYEEFLVGWQRLAEVDFPVEREPEDAYRHFWGWRVNYEALVDAIAAQILPPPAPWMTEVEDFGEVTYPRIFNRTPDDPEPSRS